jgi:hypothetical protein
MNLYTIEAEVNYDDLPVNLKQGWSPSFGVAFLDYVGENQKDVLFLSLSGQLQKKCIFPEFDSSRRFSPVFDLTPHWGARLPGLKMRAF